MSLADRTYFPPSTADELAEVSSFFAKFEAKHGDSIEPQCFLSGPGEGDHIPLPQELYELLKQAIEALRSGKAVTISPNDTVVTTQQAAELLGVSRPTVVKLIEDGELEATKITRHRRIRLDDVIRYRDRKMTAQFDFLAATTSLDEEPSAAEFKRARKDLAAKRLSEGR